MEMGIRFRRAVFVFFTLAFVNAAWATDIPVVPGGELGRFRHGTYPSLGDRTHAGVDIVAPCETNVYPLANGRVVDLISEPTDRDWKTLGYMVMVEHPESMTGRVFYTLYLHLLDSPRTRGDVIRDVPIGRVGNTGNTGGTCHLHFEVRYFKERYHPSWGNIYGPGDQRESKVFKNAWEDPLWFVEQGVFKSGRTTAQSRPEVSRTGQETAHASAQTRAITQDGKTVILYPDGTWKPADDAPGATTRVHDVIGVWELKGSEVVFGQRRRPMRIELRPDSSYRACNQFDQCGAGTYRISGDRLSFSGPLGTVIEGVLRGEVLEMDGLPGFMAGSGTYTRASR
jgi:hypothetical protein